jgi:hypothetical protein
VAVLRLAVILVFFIQPALAVAQASSCDVGEVSASAPTETQQFAFLLGEHEVTLHAWTGSAWTPPRPVNAHWRGWYGLSGAAIYDEWVDPAPNTGGLGVNVRIYDPEEAVWKMMWVSTTGMQVQDLRAEMRGGVLTMWQVYPERPGWKAEFEVLDDDRWARVSYQQDEAGAWQPQFRLVATRQPC